MTENKLRAADILIIEDNDSDALLMREAIRDTMAGNNIIILHDASDAIKYLNREGEFKEASRPDLILLDLKMPDLDGHEFLRIIKKDPRFAAIPVIVMTTSGEDSDIAKSYELGANCYVVKPVNFMKFRQVISVVNDFWIGITRLPPK